MKTPPLEPSPNPYAAPQAPLARAAADPRSWTQRIADEWHRGAWPLVFILNLVLPGLLGFVFSSLGGRIGMIFVSVALLCFSTWLTAGNGLLRARWIAGGQIVAALQLVPFFHFLIGLGSLWLLAHLRLLSPAFFQDEDLYFLTLDFKESSLLTLLVGVGLMLFAFLLGMRQVSKVEQEQLLS